MSSSNLRLNERAALTWIRERTAKESERIGLHIKYEQAVRRRLEEMFGRGYEVMTDVNENGNVIARVDDVRFSTFIYNEEVMTIILVVTCPSCGRDVYLGEIKDLAELGEALEAFSLGLRHECRACRKARRVVRDARWATESRAIKLWTSADNTSA